MQVVLFAFSINIGSEDMAHCPGTLTKLLFTMRGTDL
jgi:hypothetical protein